MNDTAYLRRNEPERRGPRRIRVRRIPLTGVLRIAIAIGAPFALLFSCVATGMVVAAVRAARALISGFSSRTINGPLNLTININPIELLGMQDIAGQVQRTDDGMFLAAIFIFFILVLVAETALILIGFFGGILSDLVIWATGGITLDVEDA